MDPIGAPPDPDAQRRHAEQLHRVRDFEAANAAFDAVVREYLAAGCLGDAIATTERWAAVLTEQRDYRAAHDVERRAWHLAEGTRALEDGADAWEFDPEVAAVHVSVARQRFVAAGFEEAVAIADVALEDCGGPVLDLPALDLELETPDAPVFRG